jgi:phosphoglycolate phosphatase-like HAD superfamily hydrolase
MEAVLFDIDGTLIRTGGAGVRAFARAAERLHGLPDGTAHMVFHGRTDTSLVREYLRHHGLPETTEEMERFLGTYLGILEGMLAESAGEACPGVREFIASCRGLDRPPLIGLLTGNVRHGAELKLRAHGLWGEFELGGYGDDHEDRDEVAAVAVRRVMERLGRTVRPQDVLVVGDTPRDVQCARAVGARVLAVATGGFGLEALRACEPDWLVETLDDFPALFLRDSVRKQDVET